MPLSVPLLSAGCEADGRPVVGQCFHDRAGLALAAGTAPSAPSVPRIGGLGRAARRDLLREFACLGIGPAAPGGACPGFMKTRYSGCTVATTIRPTAPRDSPHAARTSLHGELGASRAIWGCKHLGLDLADMVALPILRLRAHQTTLSGAGVTTSKPWPGARDPFHAPAVV